jgi:hypothetical protein
MLFSVTAICCCIERNTRSTRVLAWALFIVGGALVEFWWFGMLFCIAAWHYCRKPTWSALFLACIALASLTIVNGNWWAFAVVPLIVAAPFFNARVPRVRWAFYVFYPVHLAILLVLAYR